VSTIHVFMIRINHFLSIALCLLFKIINAQYEPKEFCFRSCELAIANSVQFNGTDPKTGVECSPATCACVVEQSIASLYLCNQRYCSEEERVESLEDFNRSCLVNANVSIPNFQEVVGRYGDEEVRKLRHLSKTDAIAWPGPWPIVNEAVIIKNDLYKLAYDTLVSFGSVGGGAS